MGPYPLRVQRGFDDVPRGNPRCALDLYTTPSQPAIRQWGRGFHTVWGGIDAGIAVFIPLVLDLQQRRMT